MITSKQRAFLRAKSNNLPDLVFIGKEGVTNTVIEQIKNNLVAHELIKIKVQQNADFGAKELGNELAKTTESECVSVVGSKIVLYQFSEKKKVHILV